MAFVQSFNSNRKKDLTDPYGGFSANSNVAGGTGTNAISTETGLLKDTSGGKLANAQDGGSGRFVNLQNYLDANKGQAVDLSQGVGQHIGDEVGQAKTALTTAADTYKADVAKNTRTYDEKTVADVLSNPNAAANAENVRKFNELQSGSYAGPVLGGTSTFDPAVSQVREAQQAGANVNNAGGQVALLKQMSTDRPYTTGGYNFNQLLLQNNDAARANITEAGKQADPLAADLTGAFTNAANQTAQAQLNNYQVADKARAAVAAETAALEGKWKTDAAAIDATKQLRSDELINKIANLPVAAKMASQQGAMDQLQLQKMVTQNLKDTGLYGNKRASGIQNQFAVQNVAGSVSGAAPVDTSYFTDQDLADMGMTRLQMTNMLRARQRVVDMGGEATDLSQWLSPYVHTTTAAGAASSEDANRYNNLNMLIGQAPTQNVSQAAIDAAHGDKAIFDTKEAYARMQTEMTTIQAQQQAKWAKEQELRSAQIMADAQKAAAQAQMISSAIMAVAMIAIMAFSDENLKTDINETSSDDITRLLNDLTGGK